MNTFKFNRWSLACFSLLIMIKSLRLGLGSINSQAGLFLS
jgi:hypothetical protein